jgi:hypothetical protein
MSSEQFIFIGFPLEDSLAERFATCGDSVRVFFEDPTYLETVRVDGRGFVGKRIEVGAAGDRLEDTVRSVISMIARIAPGFELEPGDARLLALEERRPLEMPRET